MSVQTSEHLELCPGVYVPIQEILYVSFSQGSPFSLVWEGKTFKILIRIFSLCLNFKLRDHN